MAYHMLGLLGQEITHLNPYHALFGCGCICLLKEHFYASHRTQLTWNYFINGHLNKMGILIA